MLPMSDGPIPPIASNTYAGHVWTLRSVETGEVILTWRIESGVTNQRFVLRASDITPAGITTSIETTETSPEGVRAIDSDEL